MSATDPEQTAPGATLFYVMLRYATLEVGLPVLMDSFWQRAHKPACDGFFIQDAGDHYRSWRFSGVSRGSDH